MSTADRCASLPSVPSPPISTDHSHSSARVTLCKEWDEMIEDFFAELSPEEKNSARYKSHVEEDLAYVIADEFDALVKCKIKECIWDGKLVYEFVSPHNISVIFSDPHVLAENLVAKDILDYVMYNVEDGSVKVRVEAECEKYKDLETWKHLLKEIKRLVSRIHREENYSEESGYFLNFFNDGILFTLVTPGEAHAGELPEETRAAIFLCKPIPEYAPLD